MDGKSSNDLTMSPQPGTSDGRSTGNCKTRRPKDLPKKAKAAKPKMSGQATQDSATNKKMFKHATEEILVVMDQMTLKTLFTSAKVLLNILVNANDWRPKDFWHITEYIVQKAIDEQKNSNMYAHLCSEACRKSLVDPRDEVRATFGDLFKRELVAACNKFQSVAWISNQTRSRTGKKGKRVDKRNLEIIDSETRKLTLGASRFLGELYTANTFKLLNAVTANIDTLMRARDEKSLQCLCVLMTEIGSKLEKVKESATEWTAKKIYAELRIIASRGRVYRTLPPTTIKMIDKLLSTASPGKSDKSSIGPGVSETSQTKNVAGDKTIPDISKKSNDQLKQSLLAVMKNLTVDTVFESSRVLLDILVKASEDKHMNFGLAMDYIVQKALDNTEDSDLYACLCSEAKKKASRDPRDSVRIRFADIFKIGLLRSCNKVLWDAGIHASSSGPAETAQPIPKEVDATTRGRMLQTCIFLGHLYFANEFNMYNIGSRLINALLKAQDEYSLECLCTLLSIIGPRFDIIRVDDRTELISAKYVYKELKRLAITGYTENTMSLRTVRVINKVLRLKDNKWTIGKLYISQELVQRYHTNFMQNVELETRFRECIINTKGSVHKGWQP